MLAFLYLEAGINKPILIEREKPKKVTKLKTFYFEGFSCEALNQKNADRKYKNYLNNLYK